MAQQLRHLRPLGPLLERRPLCLASDIDGTLAPIVPRPEDAAVLPPLRTLLSELVSRQVRLALITGRTLAAARAMLPLEGAAFAANHGLTLWLDGREETVPGAAEYLQWVREATAEIAAWEVPGVGLEEKGPGLAVHYRAAPDQEAARRIILKAIASSPAAARFRLHEGRKVIELRPPLAIDKGTALAALVDRLGAASLICLGDDTTDIDMFRAVAGLRQRGLPGAAVAVRSEESTPEVLAAADYWVEGTAGVEWLLRELVTDLPGRPP